ncbi:TetR/AcrR family transcriptional regulator [uncultured Desulfuromonas sp.]|uniref:TetR/AcrR family transcriptional regulator n=1 Tax=uncultured Desulfuromonas sp. TaxID=181013 RepID=UPI00263A13AC|nr:TetR/AcrR family transcriptional regulator [uncultured Desulfuromonas sp.]
MKTRKIDPQAKMDRVVEIARRLFVEKGYHNVSIPQIVKASGVSTGAIYHHFSNKESLASYIHEQTLGEFNQLLSARLVGTSSVYQRLRAFAQLVLDIAENDSVMMEYMLFMKHTEFMSESHPICFSEPFRWVQETIREGMEKGELKQGDVMVAGASFTGVVLRVIEVYLAGVLEVSLQEAAEETIANAWSAIKA